jgi:hypothetical protein
VTVDDRAIADPHFGQRGRTHVDAVDLGGGRFFGGSGNPKSGSSSMNPAIYSSS